MSNHECLRVNEPEVIGEHVDGEIVLVSFISGCYYSIQGTGADIVSMLRAAHSPGEIVDSLASHHQLDATQLRGQVMDYVNRLVSDQLFVPCTASDHPGAANKGHVSPTASRFSVPELLGFNDMADQLLLDPIHEMDSLQWPGQDAAA